MILEHLGYIALPPHARKGGFDHAAYHRVDSRLSLLIRRTTPLTSSTALVIATFTRFLA